MRVPLYVWPLGAALLGSLAALVHYQGRAREAETRAQTLGRQLSEVRFEAKQAKEQWAALQSKAAELDSQLGAAKTRSTASETRSTQLTRELGTIKRRLTEREQREIALLGELDTLRQKVAAGTPAPSAPPQHAPGPTQPAPEPPADLAAYHQRITALEAQLTGLLTRALATPVNTEPPPGTDTPRPASPGRQVVKVGPSEAFVIVDYGSADGAKIGDDLTLIRGTQEVGRVQITDARPHFSLAHPRPAARKGQLQPGDTVILVP